MQRFLKERVSRKTSELSNLGTSELLIDILKEISDPLAVISKDRRIVFTSASFSLSIYSRIERGRSFL